MTPEQERAEARETLDNRHRGSFYDQMYRENVDTWLRNSLDREEQLILELEGEKNLNEQLMNGSKVEMLERLLEKSSDKVAEQDKEIQRLRELLDIEIKAHSKTADKYHRAINKLENHFYQS